MDGIVECFVDDAVLYTLVCYYPVGAVVHSRVSNVDPLASFGVVPYGNGETDLLTASKSVVTTPFRAIDAFTGAAVGDAITATRVMNVGVDPAVQIGDTSWFNDTTQTDIATIDLAKIKPLNDPAVSYVSVTIASGQSLSDAVDLGNYRIDSIWIPASVGTTTILSFATSTAIGATYVSLKDRYGQEVRLNNITANGNRGDIGAELLSARFVKLRRGTADTPNTEAVAHTYILGLMA